MLNIYTKIEWRLGYTLFGTVLQKSGLRYIKAKLLHIFMSDFLHHSIFQNIRLGLDFFIFFLDFPHILFV